MCGIFGFSGKKGKKADLKKLKILGVYNIQRGTDSCGYYYSGNVSKGIDKEANFTKFIDQNEILRGNLIGEVFMGHTRKSTFGANTSENAHPHCVNNYVQTHNGTIKEPWKLCEKYGIDHKNLHVDSIGLANIIQKVGFEVLHNYEGYAALAMTFMDDSESLYLYHGASREKENGEIWEERPLFILKQPEGIYYSSLEESLNFISSNKNRAEDLPHNYVYKIVNGEITDYEYKVNRENNNITKVTYNYNTYGTYQNYNYNSYNYNANAKQDELPFGDTRKSKELSILLEDYPDEFVKQDVYFRRGRFYRDENILLHGKYRISRDGFLVDDKQTTSVTGRTAENYYFVRGVMMASENLYNKCLKEQEENLNKLNSNTGYYLSKYSRYPVTTLECEGLLVTDELKLNWYKNNKMYSGTFNTKFSSRTYEIKSGRLKSIKGGGFSALLKEPEKNYEDLLDSIDIIERNMQTGTFEKSPKDCCEAKGYEKVVAIVQNWADKEITEDNLRKIPEVFFKFIDYYILTFLHTLNDEQLEGETTIIVHDLIKLGVSLRTYLSQYNDTYLLEKDSHVFDLFKNQEVDTMLEEDNRYEFIEAIIEQDSSIEIASIIEDLAGQLEDLNAQADKLQAINSDDAQEMAFALYQSIDTLSKTFREVQGKQTNTNEINF